MEEVLNVFRVVECCGGSRRLGDFLLVCRFSRVDACETAQLRAMIPGLPYGPLNMHSLRKSGSDI